MTQQTPKQPGAAPAKHAPGKPDQGAVQAPHQKEQQKNGPAQTAQKQPERPENAAKRS